MGRVPPPMPLPWTVAMWAAAPWCRRAGWALRSSISPAQPPCSPPSPPVLGLERRLFASTCLSAATKPCRGTQDCLSPSSPRGQAPARNSLQGKKPPEWERGKGRAKGEFSGRVPGVGVWSVWSGVSGINGWGKGLSLSEGYAPLPADAPCPLAEGHFSPPHRVGCPPTQAAPTSSPDLCTQLSPHPPIWHPVSSLTPGSVGEKGHIALSGPGPLPTEHKRGSSKGASLHPGIRSQWLSWLPAFSRSLPRVSFQKEV